MQNDQKDHKADQDVKHKKSVSYSEEVQVAELSWKPDARIKDWKVLPRYEVKEILGSGAYGCVSMAKDLEEKRRVAIKRCGHLFNDLSDAKRVLREIAILSELDHPHIVQCYDIVVPAKLNSFNEIYIVLEMSDSDLKKLTRATVSLDHVHVHSVFYNLLVGLHYLHSAGILHRDLKPANCLVNEDCSVKICDFGLARAVGCSAECLDKQYEAEKRNLTGHVVTRYYRAPELILLQQNYTEAIDVWSAGCIFVELMQMLDGQRYEDRGPLFPGESCFPLSPRQGHTQDPSFYTRGKNDQLRLICSIIGVPSEEDIMEIEAEDARAYVRCFKNDKPPVGLSNMFGKMDPQGADLLDQMLQFSPSRRITVHQALEHEIFKGLRGDKHMETVAEEQISLDFETEEVLDEKALRALFLREIRRYHPELPEV